MLKNPRVVNITSSSEIPGKAFLDRNGVRRAGQDKKHNFTTSLAWVDDRFINTFKMKLAAGRSFRNNDISPIFNTPNTRVLINEVIVKALGYRSNEDAIGRQILFTLGRDDIPAEIIGVVKNYHQRSLKESYDPILYFYPPWTNWKYYTVRFNSNNLGRELAYTEDRYKEVFSGNAFEYFFLDEFFNRQYISDKRFSRIFTLFTVLAIFVACLGLYGLSRFFIKLRTKEIGVRKVLGASVYSILVLFSKEFILLVVIASAIATPVVYFAANRWLANFAFHIHLNWVIFLVPPLVLLIISIVTVSLQSLKTAVRNPVAALRSE
jgi:putative ABC transport system permease protein